MLKRAFLVLSLVGTLVLPSSAGDWMGQVNLIYPCSDNWYEVQLTGKTAAWQGSTKSIRFMFKSATIGAGRFNQLYVTMLTAFTAGSNVWLGTREAQTTFLTGGNCGGGNVPAQEVLGASIYK